MSLYTMHFYATLEENGTIHVQNAVMGMMGQHHVHTPEDFERWKAQVKDTQVEWLKDTKSCSCGLQAGEVRDHDGRTHRLGQ